MRKYNQLQHQFINLKIDFKRLQEDTNSTLSRITRDYYNLTQGSESSVTKRQFLSDRNVYEAKFGALEDAYNRILEVLELKNIKIKTNCPECKQELPEDYNES